MALTAVFDNLDTVLADVPRVGVIHLGAHRGQEVPAYRAARFERIVLVEPNPRHHAHLAAIPDTVLVRAAVGEPGRATLHVPRWDTLASLRMPIVHDVRMEVRVDVVRVADVQHGCNVLVADIQGGELDALRTADLDALDAVILECSDVARYEGGATTDDVTAFMLEAGWWMIGRYPHRGPGVWDVAWVK